MNDFISDALPQSVAALVEFDENRFLRYYRWVGPIWEKHKGQRRTAWRRQTNRRKDWWSQSATDETRHYCLHAVAGILWLYRECKADEARAWRLWQKRWPRELADLKARLLSRQIVKAAYYRPPSFQSILAEINAVLV